MCATMTFSFYRVTPSFLLLYHFIGLGGEREGQFSHSRNLEITVGAAHLKHLALQLHSNGAESLGQRSPYEPALPWPVPITNTNKVKPKIGVCTRRTGATQSPTSMQLDYPQQLRFGVAMPPGLAAKLQGED